MVSRNHPAGVLILLLLGGTPAPADGRQAPGTARQAGARFADLVLQATQILSDAHVRKPDEREMVAWAVRELWGRFHRQVPPGLQRLLDRVPTMNRDGLRALLIEVRDRLGQRPELDDSRDVDLALAAIYRRVEPAATPLPLRDQIRKTYPPGSYDGEPGIQVRTRPPSGMLEVVTPVLGGPAYRAGIRAGDVITRITHDVDRNGRPLPEPLSISTKGLSVEAATQKLLGKEGTKLKLTILRPNVARETTIELTRARISAGTVLGARRGNDDRFDYLIDPENRIGYVRLKQFTRDTLRELEKAMKGLSGAGIKGLVLDLRFNPGGLLDSAVKISDLFTDDGLIVTIRPRKGQEVSYVGRPGGSYTAFPIACLINGETTRMSELVAACLQDEGRAVMVGERTAGGPGVSMIAPLGECARLSLTTATFARPCGKNLSKLLTDGSEDQDWGVRPDAGFFVPLSAAERAALHEHLRAQEIIPRRDRAAKPAPPFRDRQLEAALAYLRGQIASAERAPRQAAAKRGWERPRLLRESVRELR